jgi:DNA-binding transcriptional LysR family regulator
LVLRAVRREGGVLPAAQALHLTPSGISQHLRRLESETGIALVNRSRRGGGRSLELTADGQRLAEHAERVAEALADTERTVEALRGRRGGPVGIGGFASALEILVAPTVARLVTSRPAIEAHLVEIDDDAGLGELVAGRLDLLVCDRIYQQPRTTKEVEERELLHDPFRVVIPDSWDHAMTATELLNGPWITAPAGYTTDRMLTELAAPVAATPQRRHVCTESTTMLALVAAGLGAAIVPELSLTFLRRTGVRPTGLLDSPVRVITVCHRPGATQPGTVTATVLDLLRETASAP